MLDRFCLIFKKGLITFNRLKKDLLHFGLFTNSKSTIETLEKGVIYVQS